MEFPAAQRPRRLHFRTLRTISALILREMSSTYGRSPGGYIWVIFEPVAGIALMSVVFSLILRSPALGTNFPYFFATGILPFVFFNSITSQLAASIRFSRPFLSYPAVTFFDALVARFLLNALTQMLVLCLVIAGIVVFYNLHPILDWPSIFLAIAMLIAMTVSLGVLNCYLFSILPIWERIWVVLMRPQLILSGVLFIPEIIPARFRDLFMLNPVAHVISQFRKGFFETYDAVHVSPVYVFIISLILGTFGFLFLLRNHKSVIDRL